MSPLPSPRGWLLGPWRDSLLLANLAWPLVLLLPLLGDDLGELQFWQVYFVTTPHRWITLPIVFLDRDRLDRGLWLFLGLALVVVAIVAGIRLTTGTLLCLLTVDYLWNAWHFAAQHHGVYRIYCRVGGWNPSGEILTRWAMRGFLLYVTLRVVTSTWTTPWTVLEQLDWLAWCVPVALIARHLWGVGLRLPGGLLYLASVSGLYSALLVAVHLRRTDAILALTLASALFHAVEYLTLVARATDERQAKLGDRMGWLGLIATAGVVALIAFVLIVGAGSWYAEQNAAETWLLVNACVAFLHYSYDGIIWRRPSRPERST